MGVTFTKEQQQVINLRGRNILVSAAAGSGKTAVLVERIITRLTKDTPPIDVDQLLVVTFTEAAASEMKERIHDAIEQALQKDPENVHLQRQATLIHQAKITTIHQFCLSVIRDYFYTIDLDPGFRVGEEGELKLLKRDVVEAVLEAAYEEGTDEFHRFVESFASGKDDRKLEDLLLQLYEFSRSYPNPKSWLEEAVKQYDIRSMEELEGKPFIRDAMGEVRKVLCDIQGLLERGIAICEEEDGPKVYRDTLLDDILQMKGPLEAQTFTEMQQAISQVQWVRLATNRDKTVSEYKASQVKNIRENVKGLMKTLAEQFCFEDAKQMQEDMLGARGHMETLTGLVQAFADAFGEEKRRKNLIDFNDMEQYALQILTREEEGIFVPSEAAESYQQKFEEIMIDEYQDSNLVQEAILTSVSGLSKGIHNIFMVGDVKQSIYRFRLSRPELFMEKYGTYTLEDSQKQRIDLHKNFRSRREVLDSTNYVFEQIMIPEFGGIAYDERAALYVGADYEEKPGNETEVLLVEAPETKAEQRMELEAEVIAQRIKELMKSHTVYDKKSGKYRPLRLGDIVILSRSLKGWTNVCSEVLGREGIATYTSSNEGYFQTQEIELLLCYLKILDNPRQDIPFAAVLSSMFGEVSSEELAILRSESPKGTLYESVLRYIEHGQDEKLQGKLVLFMEQYERFRSRVPYLAIHTLLWQLLDDTGFGDYAAALPGGAQRSANLDMLLQKAVTFESTSYKGLFHFVRYIEQLQKYEVDYGEASLVDEKTDVVNLMSIHKSKGLEFPIVFVAGLGKQFNMQDTRSMVVIHPELGIGIDLVDLTLRTKVPTLLKKIIQQKLQRESTAEELRVLYVAMTRAKEKLILTGTTPDLAKELKSLSVLGKQEEVALPYYLLTGANKYLDWILGALYRNQCLADILEQCDMPAPYQNSRYFGETDIRVRKVTIDELACQQCVEEMKDAITKQMLDTWDTHRIYHQAAKEQIEEQFAYTYPYDAGQNMKQKLSVSDLKKRVQMEEDVEFVYPEEEVMPLLPKFLQDETQLTGASRGTAYHKVLEVLDFSKEYDEVTLKEELERKVAEGVLTEEMLSCIRPYDILQFLQSDIGRRLQKASRAGTYFAEQPFVLGVEAREIYPEVDSEELLLVQGIIDVYFEEEGELIVLDYKTDKVSEAGQLTQRYHTQLDYYARALERLTGKRVKQKMIYSFALQAEVEVP